MNMQLTDLQQLQYVTQSWHRGAGAEGNVSNYEINTVRNRAYYTGVCKVATRSYTFI